MQVRQVAKFLLHAILVLSFAAGAFSAFAQTHVSNPFVGATQYVNPDYTKEVQALIATTTDPTLKAQMNTITTYSTGIWMDRIAAIAGSSATGGRLGLQEQLDNAVLVQQAAGKPVVIPLVIYDLPDRDCAARASNGELSIAANPPTQPLDGLTTYETQYIDVIAGILKNPKYVNLRFALIIEPDSLPNLVTNTGKSFTVANCVLAQSSGVYVQGVQHAINAFHPIPNAYLYLDIGHSAWLGWPDNASAAVSFFTTVVSGAAAGLNSIDGFIDNTANYTPTKEPFISASQAFNGSQIISANFYSFNATVDEAGYATELQTLFRANGWPISSTNFITDTSRNGWGGPNRPAAASTSTDVNTFVDASRIDRRNHRGQWCNQSGAGLGVPPLAAPPDFPQFQAYVWIKPPGESDGTYPGSANQQGAVHADPNCDPAQTNPLAGNTLTGSIANSPPAGNFFAAELIQNIQNSFPAVPASTTPDFSISANGASVMQASTTTTSVTVLPVNNFSGTVALSVGGLPAGVTAAFSPASVTGAAISTLTFTASATATVGPATVNITGTSGTLTHRLSVNLAVVGRPDFSITAAPPAAVTITPGSNPTATISVAALFGFTGSVSITATGLPAGVSANFSPSSVNGSGTIVANFNAQSTTPAGTTNISIVGTSGTLTHSATIALTVTGTATPDFVLAAANASVAQGGTATSTITVNRLNGFAGSVALTASGLPSGVTASFNPASTTTGASSLTFTASATAAVGAATVTVTGVSGTLTHAATLVLTVISNTPNFSLSSSPASATVAQGGTSSSTITVTPSGGFTGAVALSASGLPTGVTAAFSPISTTGASTLTFTASSTASLGAATVTITGVSGTLTHTTTISLTVNAVVIGTGGVTVTPVINSNSPFFDDEGVKLSNTAPLTALAMTITVQNTGGITFNGQFNTVGSSITQSHSSTATSITYQFNLAAGQTLTAGSGFLFDAQMGGSGTAHPTTGDTFTLTYTTGGQTFTQSGHF
jgi:cellulose 1,4-beta-cellobiosidase